MNRRKPDLLFILIFILGFGVVITSYGSHLMKDWEVLALERDTNIKKQSDFFAP